MTSTITATLHCNFAILYDYWREIFRPSGANTCIINVARRHSQHLFCDMKKLTKNQYRV